MKKIWKRIISVLCVACMAVGFTACKDDAVTAYEIAVENGFVGTEAEWLASLHGANGEDGQSFTIEDLYAAAKAEGFEGSLLEFIQSLGVDVKENNDTDTIANNVMSVTSIYCGFSKTVKTGGLFQPNHSETTYYASAGAGVILDLNKQAGNALIVTNYHVLYDAESDAKGISEDIYVYGYGDLLRFDPRPNGDKGGGMKATYVGGAMDYDIALLKVEGKVKELKNATEAELGNSEEVRLGEKVFAIGNPKGEGIAVTAGVISTDSEYITMASTDGQRTVDYRVMRTDAAINSGNSGGALFDANGKLIGITNAKYASEDVDNVGYALPITQVKNLCDNMLANDGVVKRAMLGVKVSTTDSYASLKDGRLQLFETFAVAEAAGKDGSSYNKFNVGDIFLTMKVNDGEEVTLTRQYQVNDLLLTVRLNDTVTFKMKDFGNGNQKTVSITFDKESYFTLYK